MIDDASGLLRPLRRCHTKLVKEIGKGQFSSGVWTCHPDGSTNDELMVAKILHNSIELQSTGHDNTLAQRLWLEGPLLKSLDHHNIVKCFEYGLMEEGHFCLLLEYPVSPTTPHPYLIVHTLSHVVSYV